MRWITRKNVKVDRVACPWLIKTFIDPRAEFLFVREEELLEKARLERAIPFDATRFPQVKLNHRGERCTFEAILEDYKLSDPALQRHGLIGRGADMKGQEQASPESMGLRAMPDGFALSASTDEASPPKSMEVFSMIRSIRIALLLVSLCFLTAAVWAQNIPSDYQDVLKSLDRKGDFKDGVLKVNIPRSDLKITVAGVATPTPFGFGGWVAFTKTSDGGEVMMGDLVLLQEEVNQVLSALLDNGIEVTALHNHFFWDDPHVYYMHVHGMGKAADLARKVRPAFDLIGHVKAEAVTPLSGSGAALDTAKIAQIVGHTGEQSGTVYKITVGRSDIAMKDHGATINARMGLNTWAAFYGTQDDAVVAGDIAMLEGEVTPVLKTLRKNGIDVVAIHHHMTEEKPLVIFLHCWGRGPADKLANAFKATLGELGKGASSH